MPEYLAPGVFVEELPARMRAIEGVSTSTAGFVGPSGRGPVAGFPLPFVPVSPFTLTRDVAPVLVTSLADFVRTFGAPLAPPLDTDSTDRGYLGHAVRAFFDNGGRRAYISRVVDAATATRGSGALSQGPALRLVRRPEAGATVIGLNSLRGVRKGVSLTFRRRADGSNALVTQATPATLLGTMVGPFALQVGDTVSVSVSGGAPAAMTPVAASPATLTTGAAGPFTLADLDTLQVRVGATGPVQVVTFHTADFTTIASATAGELALVLARDLKGVSVAVDATGHVVLRTDVSGQSAALAVLGGTASLGFSAVAGGGNVQDVDHVSSAEIATLFSGASGFTVGSDGAGGSGHLLITSSTGGAGVTLAASSAVVGALTRLGLPAAGTPGGGGGAAPAVTVSSYDTLTNEVTLGAGLPIALDPAEVYVESAVMPVSVGTGPKFFARSPGSWSADLRVLISPTERAPSRILEAVLPGGTQVKVASATSFYVGALIEIDNNGTTRTTHEVAAIAGQTLTIKPALAAPLALINPSYARVLEIEVAIADVSGAAPTEVFKGLTWRGGPAADTARHYAAVVNARSKLVYVQPPGGVGETGTTVAEMPTTANGFPASLDTLGVDGLPSLGLTGDSVYVGADLGPGQRTGLQALLDVPDIRIIAAPGRTGSTVQLALITQCELLRYRFAVLDGEQPPDGASVNTIQAHRNLYDSSHAAYYGPWIGQVIDGEQRFLPPSGAVAGIYARVDNQRGVWKAPANEGVQNASSLQTYFTTGEQEVLNPRGVNLLRRFEQGGIRVWGARTLSSNPEVKYVNVRRTLIFLEASIEQGTQWVVFEPNTPDTWSRVVDSIKSFLNTQWREGALFGRSAEDAYFVRCDETTMTADDVLNGRLICHIGVAIVRPAEFVIFRIEQLTGFSQQ